MKTKKLYGKKDCALEIREAELADPDVNEALVRVDACGVCGTDIHFLRDWDDDPVPLGHEIAGEVIAVGSAVSTVKPGDTVIVEDCTLCGTCPSCKNGRADLCRNMFGLDDQSGLGQYLRVRHNNLVKYDGLPSETACLTEPLAVSLNSVLYAEIPPHGSVLVLGCGPLGLMSARVAQLFGAGFTAIADVALDTPPGRARGELARKWGMDLVIDSRNEDLEAEIKQRFPEGVDRVIVSAPPESFHDALKVIAYGGIIAFYGLHLGGRNRVELDINDLIFRKITLRPVFAEPALNFNRSLELLHAGRISAADLVTHTFTFDDARERLGSIVAGTDPVIKAVMRPHA